HPDFITILKGFLQGQTRHNHVIIDRFFCGLRNVLTGNERSLPNNMMSKIKATKNLTESCRIMHSVIIRTGKGQS
ncbi:MAG: hypothetical protein JW996_06905, partial [Candidatus Cloacimonetes bacterium]|nr:hypothetical protein [Candidatus Cloacimonadota bacterium]